MRKPTWVLRSLQLAGLAVCTIASSATAQGDRNLQIQNTREVFSEWNDLHSPGCAVGVVRDGEVLFTAGYGSANLDYNIPITSESVFYIASTSKQFTAASIALLALRGKLSLDDDIQEYVPEIPEYDHEITIRNLVHHTSGLRDYLTLRGLAGESFEDFFDNQWGIDLLSRQRALNFEPGTEFLYSNSGYMVLAEIVKRVSGQSMQEFGQENLFGPLGMGATQWGGDRQKVIPNRVISYDKRDQGDFRRWVKNFHAMGDGNLLTTVEDILKWDQMFYDSSAAWRPLVTQVLTPGVLDNGEELDYAFGLMHGEYRGYRTVSHGGGFLGFRTELMRFPEQHFSAVALCNFGSASPGTYVQKLVDIWLFEDDGPVGDEGTESEEEPERINLPRGRLASFAGVYRSSDSPFGDVVLSLGEHNLVAELAGASMSLVPIGQNEFRPEDGPAGARFVLGEEDGVEVLHLSAPGLDELTLTKSDLPAASREETGSLIGEYYSEELDVTYELSLHGDTLFARLPDGEQVRLRPVGDEEFSMRGNTLRFERDTAERVGGFKLDAGRVRGLWFTKRNR